MSVDQNAVQIAHVVFLDAVGYSLSTTASQGKILEQVNAALRQTKAFRAAQTERTVHPLPAGDEVALLFFG